MLHTLCAGLNQFFNAKTTFCMIFFALFYTKKVFFVYFVPLVTEKVVLSSESLFRRANGVRSTRSLVEIHNSPFSGRVHSGTKLELFEEKNSLQIVGICSLKFDLIFC